MRRTGDGRLVAGGGAQPGAGAPSTLSRYDPQILQLLAVYSNGATAKELATFMDELPYRVRRRLTNLRDAGKVISFQNPIDAHQTLWALPQDHLTQAKPRHFAPPHLRGKGVRR